MKDSVRKELKELCYYIIENNNSMARPEQLTRVQMLYERLLVLNYLEELEEEGKSIPANLAKAQSNTAPQNREKIAEETPASSEVEDTTTRASRASEKTEKPAVKAEIKPQAESSTEKEESKPRPQSSIPPGMATINSEAGQSASINDKLAKGAISVGLNDRIAFVKHLFNDSQADFNRVLSQLNTLDTYLESMYFIENLVKPDYEWENKKPYEDRLISLVKKRFGEDW